MKKKNKKAIEPIVKKQNDCETTIYIGIDLYNKLEEFFKKKNNGK